MSQEPPRDVGTPPASPGYPEGQPPRGGPPDTSASKGNGQALASLVVGCIAILAWCCPIIGVPLTIVGLVLGVLGLNSQRRNWAIAGLILNGLFLVASIANAVGGLIFQLNNHGGAPLNI